MPKEKDELARQEELSIMAGNLEKYKKFCVMYADLHLGTFPMKKKEKYDKSSTHIKSKKKMYRVNIQKTRYYPS